MTDAATTTSAAATPTPTPSTTTTATTGTNDPANPSTWTPAFAAQIQQSNALYAAQQAAAANAPALAQLTPCAALTEASFTTLMNACITLGRASEDFQFGSLMTSFGSVGLQAQTRFTAIYTPLANQAATAAAGATAPTGQPSPTPPVA